MRILFAGRPIACELGVLKVFIVDLLAILLHRMRMLFISILIACEIGVLEVFIVRILFAGRPIACEMGILKVLQLIFDLAFLSIFQD